MTEQFPIKATHKNFGEISITGIRTESNSNNNTMYQFRLNGELVWGYDYEITILSPIPHQDGASAEEAALHLSGDYRNAFNHTRIKIKPLYTYI